VSLSVAAHWYQTRRLADAVTLIWEPHVSADLRCNMWHVRGRERDLLIDSGLGLVPLRSTLAELCEREILAVASHTHFDHVGAHHEFEHRLCHPLEADVLAQPSNENTVFSDFSDGFDPVNMLQAVPDEEFSWDRYSVNPAPATRLIDEGDELDLGDRLFKVFHMPGHSPGSICLYEPASSTLFCGDVIYDGELLDNLYHSDPECYRESLARLREIAAETFHCGHYASFGQERLKQLIDEYTARCKANRAG
jgi:glyoxylase-like metal-dependent hydrolase (beta-lactamase superfamily II)